MSENENMFENRLGLDELRKKVEEIRTAIGKFIVGQDKMIDLLITAILADGHVLIEGVPGIAKTLSAKLISKSISAGFNRIQFTPDLMPSDILGTTIFNMKTSTFEFNKGPIFSNIVLIDEINRAPAKTQAALFEVMEEKNVTTEGNTMHLERPFLVFATQNPIEHEGTYKLPEAQVDRFMFKIEIDYPSLEEEVEILNRIHENKGVFETDSFNAVLPESLLLDFQKKVKEVYIEEKLRLYIAQVVDKTRNSSSLYLGGSPRASIYIMIAAKATAAMNGRDFVTPDDIKKVVEPVLVHRVQLTPEKEMEGLKPQNVIDQIIRTVEIPR
jgi:MoxR-like ATPase